MPIPLIDKVSPKNNGTFPMVDAKDVALNSDLNQRANNALCKPINSIMYTKVRIVTKGEYFSLGNNYEKDVLYLIYE